MKAQTWHGGAHFTLDDIPDPEPQAGYVLVEIDTTGICGTDVHVTQGLFPKDPPQILGHESAGTIVDVGEGVSKDRIGQRVCINHPANCYECWYCRNWSVCRCENQPPISNGYFAQYTAVTSRSAVEIPESLDLETAALDRTRGLLPFRRRDARHPISRHRTSHRRRNHGSVHRRLPEVARRRNSRRLRTSKNPTRDGEAVRSRHPPRPLRRTSLRSHRRGHRSRTRLQHHR